MAVILNARSFASLPAANRRVVEKYLHKTLGWPDSTPAIKSIKVDQGGRRMFLEVFMDEYHADFRRDTWPTRTVQVNPKVPFPVRALIFSYDHSGTRVDL
jgi:hypothetical protein